MQRNRMEAVSGPEAESGKVRFDDRGNAVWETPRGKRLEHAGLSIAEEDFNVPGTVTRLNTKGGRVGYNPYESGMLKKKREDKPRKKDLRALSRWIRTRKSLEGNSES